MFHAPLTRCIAITSWRRWLVRKNKFFESLGTPLPSYREKFKIIECVSISLPITHFLRKFFERPFLLFVTPDNNLKFLSNIFIGIGRLKFLEIIRRLAIELPL